MRGSGDSLTRSGRSGCRIVLVVVASLICGCSASHWLAHPWAASPSRQNESRSTPALGARNASEPAIDSSTAGGPSAPLANSASAVCAHQGAVLYGVTYGGGCRSSPVEPEGDTVFAAAVATIARERHAYCELI